MYLINLMRDVEESWKHVSNRRYRKDLSRVTHDTFFNTPMIEVLFEATLYYRHTILTYIDLQRNIVGRRHDVRKLTSIQPIYSFDDVIFLLPRDTHIDRKMKLWDRFIDIKKSRNHGGVVKIAFFHVFDYSKYSETNISFFFSRKHSFVSDEAK